MTSARSRKSAGAVPQRLNKFGLKVERWLSRLVDELPIATKDPMNVWRFRAEYPVGTSHVMHIGCPSDQTESVIIASVLTVTPAQLEAFRQFTDEAKENLVWTLRYRLISVECDFRFEGLEGPLDCPRRIVTSVVRYADGLTLDSFARSLGAVYKNELLATWTLFRHLSARDTIGPFGYRFYL
jgi:hypothetical protein